MVVKTALFIVGIFLLKGAVSHRTILFFGDSLTAGYGLSPEEAFPALVERQLNAKGKPCRVINAGLSGETSAGGLTRIDWVLRQPVDIFVLELGANDGLRGLPLEQTRANLQAIIDKVKAKFPKAKIVVAGMMVPPNMGPEYSAGFKVLFPELAKKNNALLIPFLLEGVAGNEKLNLPDGIHPNTEGHKIVAANLVKVIEPLL
jgi:acyl-CoA thioesterase-1